MKKNIFPAIRITLVSLVFFCALYTLSILGISKLAANDQPYENIGQSFTSDKYFWSRPSAVDYNAAGSGGSNKAPSNPEYLAIVQARIDSFLVHNPGVTKDQIPSELVTASGSGLDPNISIESANIQITRISQARQINEETLLQLIEESIDRPLLGIFGPEKINVLKLNQALDNITIK
jgi:K+-transporting ATPase ATPase C chain